jgi:hypothetical protein
MKRDIRRKNILYNRENIKEVHKMNENNLNELTNVTEELGNNLDGITQVTELLPETTCNKSEAGKAVLVGAGIGTGVTLAIIGGVKLVNKLRTKRKAKKAADECDEFEDDYDEDIIDSESEDVED